MMYNNEITHELRKLNQNEMNRISDMTQFSQNIDKNTQKKQNSLRQLRFSQFTFHSSLFAT